MAKTKGKPRHYEEWQPEYTPKTHNLTSKSKRELNEIRAQTLAEGAVDHFDMDDVWTGGSFVGLTFCFKYGVNPSIMKLFEFGQEAIDFLKDNWVSFIIPYNVFEGGIEKLWQFEVKTRMPEEHHEPWMKMTKAALMQEKKSHKRTLEGNIAVYKRKIDEEEAQIKQWEEQLVWMHEKRDEFYAEGTMTGGDEVMPAGDRMQMSIDRMQFQISNLRAIIDGGDIVNININVETGIRGEYIRTVEVGRRPAIILLEEQIRIVADQIDRAIISKKDAEKIVDKLDWLNWIFSMGEAGALIYLLKSYEMYELVSNIKPGG